MQLIWGGLALANQNYMNVTVRRFRIICPGFEELANGSEFTPLL
jgi:hypothetical protein